MVKYPRLTEIINHNYGDCDAETMNLFIDLSSVFLRFYNGVVNENLEFTKGRTLHGIVLEICHHYRMFFRSNYGVECNIYLVHSVNCPQINSKLISGYNADHLNLIAKGSSFSIIEEQALSMLEMVSPYIQDLTVIRTTEEVGVAVLHAIHQANNGAPSLILSKDQYLYQLASADIRILVPRKDGSYGDASTIINEANAALEFMSYLTKTFPLDVIAKIPSSMISLIAALSRMPCRNIRSLVNIRFVKGWLYGIVNMYPDSLSLGRNLELIYDVLGNIDVTIYTKAPITILKQRYSTIDLQHQYEVYSSNAMSKYTCRRSLNLYNPDTLADIVKGNYGSEEAGFIMNL